MARVCAAEALEPRRLLAVSISGADTGRVFDGVGALSNSSSQLLYDYPEPQRSQILDYMFKPGYGASLQILKVEIGGDTNSTDVSEPSHERSRGVLDFTRGVEWWLMGQAKARNPNIKLYALEWGAPGWFTGGFYSADNINYIISYLDGAAQQGFNFDYVGGWNESVANPSTAAIRTWFINLKAALQVGHASTKLVAYDDGGTNWRVGDDAVSYPDFGAAIDVLGQHSPGVWRSLYQTYTVTANALSTGKPLWASEQSAESHDVGGPSWARGIVRAYEQAKITASLAWCAIDSFYPSMNHADTGIILAESPWSGYYELGSMVWVFAQTTQFTQPGWQYLDNACGQFPSGATYVSLKSNTSSDYTTVIESMDATAAETETFTVSGGLSNGTVHVWASNVASATLADDFLHVQDITPVNGTFSLTVQPGYVYTLSTTTGQGKGTATPNASVATQMALPYSENFDTYGGNGKLAKYWADIQGAFETAPATGGRSGTVYRQVITTPPIAWGGGTPAAPVTIMGDMRWWGDYQFTSDVLLEQSGYVELIGRVGGTPGAHTAGYHFQVSDSGAWKLYSEEVGGTDTTIASGTTSFSLNTWHNMALRMTGNQIMLILDGVTLTSAINGGFITGNVGIRVSNLNGAYQNAQFDNIQITRTSLPPAFVPHAQMTATASDTYSVNGGFYQGDYYLVSYAIDDRPESIWHSAFNPRVPPPHWYTIDMGSPQKVEGLTYQPRIDGNNNGMINTYTVNVSNDGVNFTPVVSNGTWLTNSATKVASWPVQQVRYVQLYESAGVNGLDSIGELNIMQTRSAASATPDLAAASDLGVSSIDNLTSLDNSSAAKKLQFAVAGTTSGAVVRLYADGTLIGTATAIGSSTTVTTDGTTTLADGAHVITATQQAAMMAESPVSAGLTITIDTTAPTAVASSAMPPTGGATFDFAVTYSDANKLDASSFDINDVTISGPSGLLPIIAVSILDSTNGSPRVVNYRVNAPGGFWNDADNGIYTITQAANQVSDLAGVARPAGTIGTVNIFNLGFTWMSGGVLNVAFNGTATPIALSHGSAGDVTVTRGSTALNYTGVSSIVVIGSSSNDALQLANTVAPPMTFSGNGGNDSLEVQGGAATFASDLAAGTLVTVDAGASATFTATQHLRGLNIAGSASLSGSGDKVLVLQSLSVAGAGQLDLSDDDLILEHAGATVLGTWNGSAYTGVNGMIASGRNGGSWNGSGIVTSMSAAREPNVLTTLAVAEASDVVDFSSGATQLWDGETIDATSVLVKYTWGGDANLDGTLNGDDYFQIDSHFNQAGIVFGYFNGDFNLDGDINGDDYFIIDSNWNAGSTGPAF